MAIFTATPTLPNQQLGTGDDLALAIEQYTGVVEGTIARHSKATPFVTVRPVRGTSTLTNEGIGESTLQVLKKGESPDATINQNNRVNLTVETPVIARNFVAQIDAFQKNYDVRSEIGKEHGKLIAKFTDQAFFIQAAKTAARTTSAFGALPGHQGGTTVTLATAADRLDPAAMYAAISDLFAGMEGKDVDPQADNVMLALRPDIFYTLMQAEHIINTTYITANGMEIANTKVLRAFGVPVVSSNNVPNSAITNHELSTVRNGNSFDGDFTKLAVVAFSPDALLAGETIPLETNVWWDDGAKGWFIDAWLAFSATANRAEYAGRIILP